MAEIECSYARSSGPGGQNVNKVNSKCILRWSIRETPSLSIAVKARFLARYASRLTNDGEIIITSDRSRDQKRNFEDCIEKLKEMVELVLRPPKVRTKTKPTKGSVRRREAGKKAQSDKKAARKRDWE